MGKHRWDNVRWYISRGTFQIRKTPVRPKNLNSKEEKQLINLPENDPKKIQPNFYRIFTQKMFFHKFDTKSIILLSIACRNCYQKTRSYGEKSTCKRKSLGDWTRFTSQNCVAKGAVFFWRKHFWNCTLTKKFLVHRLPNTGMEKNLSETRKFGEKNDAYGFSCPLWSEISPKSQWNDKFDQIFAVFAGKSIARNVFGRKIATR